MMVGYFRADFKGAINHGETPSSCNDEMGVGMDGQFFPSPNRKAPDESLSPAWSGRGGGVRDDGNQTTTGDCPFPHAASLLISGTASSRKSSSFGYCLSAFLA